MRQVRKQSKQIKRNRKPKRVRRKDWIPDNFDDLDDLDNFSQSERIMPRGEQERRRVLRSEMLATLEEEKDADEKNSSVNSPTKETPGQRGIVVEVSSSLCRVDVGGRRLVCGIRGSLSAEETGFTNVIAVGDEVVISEDGNRHGSQQGIVEAILPRRSILARPDVFHGHLQQVITANANQLLIVASWRDPHLWPELVDRYLITAERNNLSPIICVNKIDLAEDVTVCHAALRPYLDLGYRVLFTSALTGEGVSTLRKALRGQMTVLAGMSGVGKSALVAAVQPGLQLRTAEVSDHSRQGKHTTTQVNLLSLEAGGFVVDTPGIREFGLSGLQREHLVRFYPEITAVEESCRFGNCSHTHEPGCTVKMAVEQGLVSATRYHNYKKIYHSLI